MQPDVLLVESPVDAEGLMANMSDPGLVPPVAMLLYDKNDLSKASYYPFAEFSPEWQAIKFALENNILVKFMDLPFGIKKEKQTSLTEEEENKKGISKSKTKDKLTSDPLAYLAELAGYADSERWWEVTFEEQFEEEEIFPALLELLTALRAEVADHIPPETLLREAYMRNTIRTAIKEGAEKIAVVCGAWHSPVLNDIEKYKQAEDNKLLKGLKKIKPKGSWIPWTYSRLSKQSGYGAGVASPAWYQLLFKNPEEAVIRWMSRLGQLFREAGMDGSPAHVIEAVQLAETLATVRQLKLPGIEELREAALAIFCQGNIQQFELVEEKLIVGGDIGKVPLSIPKMPFQDNLEKTIKTLRWSKLWETESKTEKMLDLRKSNQVNGSQLLHRMNLLSIPWGTLIKVVKGSNAGAFHEKWELRWQPEFALKTIEAGMWGNTVAEAASQKIRNKMKTLTDLPDFTALIESAFNADLASVIPDLVEKIGAASVQTQDITQLMDALLPLVNVVRYGSSRKMDTENLLQLIEQMVPRITVALPVNCTNLDDEAAAAMFKRITAVNRRMFILNDSSLINLWLTALLTMQQHETTNPLLRGATTRILFDKEVLDIESVEIWMEYTLSSGQSRAEAAATLEGFCFGSGLLIIHNPQLWNIINDWVSRIPMDTFIELLPLLRRTFSNFSEPERSKMMNLAKHGPVKINVKEAGKKDYETTRAERILGTVQQLLN